MTGFHVYDNYEEKFVDSSRFVLRGDGELFEVYMTNTGRVASRLCDDRFEIKSKNKDGGRPAGRGARLESG